MSQTIIFKKVLFSAIVFFGVIWFLSFIIAEAQENTCPVVGGVQLMQCPVSGNCVNNMNLCPPVPVGGGTSSGSSSSTNNSCTGNLRYDLTAAQRCANLAQEQGRALGYDITCNVGQRNEFVIVGANPTGQVNQAYAPDCTVNGQTGFGAETLVGYAGQGNCITMHDAFLGTTCVYGSGYNINSGWNTLPCDLVTGATGVIGGGSITGVSSCRVGAGQIFNSPNPSNWTLDRVVGGPSCRRTATCGIPSPNRTLFRPRLTPINVVSTQDSSRRIFTTISSRDLIGNPEDYSWNFKDPYISDSTGYGGTTENPYSCTGYETTTNCHPEWSRIGSKCNSSSNLISGACRATRVNPYAAGNLAKRAETMGRNRGFNTQCASKYITYRPGIDPNTGLNYYYKTTCSINKGPSVEAEQMITGSFNWSLYGEVISPRTSESNNPRIPIPLPACALTATCARGF